MKKLCAAGVLAALLLLLCACGGGAKELPLDTVSEQLLDSGAFSDILSPVGKNIAAMIYGVEETLVESSAVYWSTGATAEELALFKAQDEKGAAQLLAAAQTRLEEQKEAFSVYVPAEVAKLDTAVLAQSGPYVICVVAEDAARATQVLGEYIK